MPDLYSDDFAVQNTKWEIYKRLDVLQVFSWTTIEVQKKGGYFFPTKRNYSYNEATVKTRKTTVRLGRCLITALFTGL